MTWQELVTLLCSVGYRQVQGSGSRVKFDNGNPLMAISLHRPHPGNELKAYVKRQVVEHLKEGGLIR
ncbi:MAG: type II toxin-antitoxin system HicA family toxin [Azoarcus sp.]|nr:type II toxin-antitoxin system HicA family toxin [Azoarcus sp.]